MNWHYDLVRALHYLLGGAVLCSVPLAEWASSSPACRRVGEWIRSKRKVGWR